MSSSGSENNLDLSKVSIEDVDKIVSKINTYYQSDSAIKSQLSWHWERNQLMLDGKQWLVFDSDAKSGGMWRRLKVSKQNEYIPRPVTNYLFANYQTLKSYLIKDKPRSSVAPNDVNNFKDKQAAKISTMICECNWERLKEQYNYETAAANGITYGTVFKKSYWDTSSRNLVKIPKMEQVPITDPATGMQVGMTEQPAIDPQTGQALFDELPLGDVNTTVVEPFRIALDPLAMHLHEAKWIMEYSIQTLDYINEVYGREGDGYTGLASEVEEEKDLNGSMRRWFQLRTSSGLKSGLSADGNSSSDTMVENSAVVKEFYEAPSAQFPKGRLFVVANNKCVYSSSSPYEGPEQGDWHPYSEFRWEIVPGRFWGKSPLDDAVEVQKQVNAIDSAIILTRKTMAVPQKLIPLNSGIEPGSWTGRPGQEIRYRNDGSGSIPGTIPGSGVDSSVFAEREQRVEDLREIMGSIDILKGQPPTSVNAASALSLLYEVGTGRLFPILDRWKKFIEDDQKKQLKLISKFYKEPRPEFIKALMAKNTDLDATSINNFIGRDLYDNCNVRVEAGSNIPKLLAAKQAMLIQLAQMNALNLADPKNLTQFHEDLGISGYDQNIEPDQKRAEWENDLLDNLLSTPDNKPVVLAVDNHDIHVDSHTRRMKSPQFMSLSPVIQQAYMMHIQEHEKFKAMAMQAQILQMQAMGPEASSGGQPGPAALPPPKGPESPGKATAHGPGPTKELKNAAMGSDIINPSNIATRG